MPAEMGLDLAVLVAVGTDVHPFVRLMQWLQRWHAGRSDRPRMLVQYGHTPCPDLPCSVPFLNYPELQRAMARTTLVVTHGGPGTITETRRHGRIPIVVPRDPRFGEHIDDHQQLFARRLDSLGVIKLCLVEQDLTSMLDAGLADPGSFSLTAGDDGQAARAQAVARVGQIVEELVAARGRRALWPRRAS
jgi:UDP-N-acetylglucosamine transferase subunit ALG13